MQAQDVRILALRLSLLRNPDDSPKESSGIDRQRRRIIGATRVGMERTGD